MNNTILGYLSGALVLLNVGLAAFATATPANQSLPWWVVAGFAAVNAIVHALPSSGVSVTGPSKPNA